MAQERIYVKKVVKLISIHPVVGMFVFDLSRSLQQPVGVKKFMLKRHFE